MPGLDTTAPATALPQQVFAGWSKAATLQAITRKVRKAGRDRKIQKVKQVLDSGDIFKTAKCLAPKTPKRRIQLRDEQGRMQSHDQEHGQLVDYFRKLYDGLRSPPSLVTKPITFEEEITAAIAKMSPAKVMPSCSAPTALWKWTSKSAAHILRQQFEYVFQPGEVHMPSAWNVSELVLLPKPGKPLRKPSDLRPISLLPPEMKILSSVIAACIRPQVQTYLASIPQFAYVSGRALQDAVTRVTSHCSEVRTLIQSQACNIHTKRGGRTEKKLYGGVQLSLDISKAFDCLPGEDLRQALVEAQVDSDMITATLIIHDEARLRITHCGRSAEVETKRGVLQGSGLSPMLWALFSGYVLRHMDTAIIDVGKTNTTYADDFHFSWTITSMAEFDKAYAAIKHVLQVLQQRGLSISADKTVIILDIRGKYAKKALRRYVVKTSKGRCIRVKLGSQCLDLKIVASHVYLGIKISFRKFEMETAQHRLQLARSVFSRLKTILCCQAVPQILRLRLWQSCVPPSLLHGLDCTGVTEVIAGKIRSLVTQQLRQIVRSYSMFTHEANEDLLIRLHVEDPIDRVYKAFDNRCSKPSMDFERLQVWESHTQWLNVLRGRLFDNSEAARQSAQDVHIGSAGQSSARAWVVPVNLVTEQFICHECGFAFATQAALNSHKYKIHFAEQDKETRQAEIHKHKQHPATEHARDGMPTCKHCGHQFETWPAFTYHVNSRNCAEIRFFYAQENNRDQLATLQDALTYRDELLQAATSLTWREMAELHVVKQHHNHCLECHHWCASPMYVKRRMKSKHPELTEIVQDVTAKITQSDLALKGPCRFCGQTFKNRRANLSSCIGVFNGHYLLRRLGRKPVTGLQRGRSTGRSRWRRPRASWT